MSHSPFDKKEAAKAVALIEKFLTQGYPPPGIYVNSKAGEIGAIGKASQHLGINRKTLHERTSKDGIYAKNGVHVNWNKFVPKVTEKVDPIEIRRLSDMRNKAEERAKSAERKAVSADALRTGIFNLAATPLLPPSWEGKKEKLEKQRETLVLMLSDIHMGELIDIAEMAGRNSYNKRIAAQRLERLFQNVIKLGVTRWVGPPPDVVYVMLMGDLVSGSIHEELAKTNDLMSIPAVTEVTECLIAGMQLLLDQFKCEIRVVSIPGNHGRLTRKPEAKSFAVDSYDTLVAWSIEKWFSARGEKRISVSAPLSGDAVVSIHGWNFCFTHGDRIGSRGGMGFIGPAATIARGMQKVISDYSADGIVIDYVMTAHFHTSLQLEQGLANGCVPGPSEFSKSLRMRSAPATQWLFTVHPHYGIAQMWKIHVGAANEGSLYRGRSA